MTAYEYPTDKADSDYYDTPRMYRYYTSSPLREGRDRRHGFLAKLFLFSMMMISFLVLMYIPVYNKATTRKTVNLAGWTVDANRDTKIYVQPNNITLLHDSKSVCPESAGEDNKLFLLIIVCSSTTNFRVRQTIRETWANYKQYEAMVETYNNLHSRYSNYSYDYDLSIDESVNDMDYFNPKVGADKKAPVAHSSKSVEKYNKTSEAKNLSDSVNKTAVKDMNKSLSDAEKISSRRKRSISDMLPKLMEAFNKKAGMEKEEVEEQRFEEDKQDDKVLPEFDMNEVLGDRDGDEEDLNEYGEPSNVMKIPPRGFEEDSPAIDKVIKLLRDSKVLVKQDTNDHTEETLPNKKVNIEADKIVNIEADKILNIEVDKKVNMEAIKKEEVTQIAIDQINKEITEDRKEVIDKIEDSLKPQPDFKLVFLLGLPSGENETEVQSKIDDESMKYGDIIQESFVDSYNNLTLKSIMMLKWIVTHCDKKVRYILKTDDDIFVNVPRLVRRLHEKAEHYEIEQAALDEESPEYFIMGYLIRNARPVSDVHNKWYSPPYMFKGRIYPRYLSGTGYVLTESAVAPLYHTALKTPFFHLEDVFITGMCAFRAQPRLHPVADETFKTSCCEDLCDLYSHSNVHRVSEAFMRAMAKKLSDVKSLDVCVRKEFNEKRKNMQRLNRLYESVADGRTRRKKPVYTMRVVRY